MTKETVAVVLAAGKGTRMKSEISKVLHKIFDKTLLGYVLDAVNKTGFISKSYVIVGHKAEEVSEFVKENYDNAKTVLQSPQLGTGDAVSKVCPELENFEGNVIVLCGDTPLITAETLKKFVEYHESNNSDITVMSAMFDNPTNYGRIVRGNPHIELDALDSAAEIKQGKLMAIVEEKDATQEQKEIKEVNAGIYCLDWKKVKPAFSQLTSNNAQGEYYLTDIIAWGKKTGLNTNAYILENNDEIFGINSNSNLAEASRKMNKRTLEKLMKKGVTIVDTDTVWISEETEIGADTVILPEVYIEGKNKIGKNCKIGPFSHLRGGVETGDGVKIGNFVEIKKSKIADNTNVCHLSYIGDSELGCNVNIGAGTITANYNHYTKVKSKTKISDGASIGSNSVIVAPVEIGKQASIGAGSIITKNIPENALAITRAPLKVVADFVKKYFKK